MGSSDSWPYFPPAMAFLASVESRIAFIGKTSNSEIGVPKLSDVCRISDGERSRLA